MTRSREGTTAPAPCIANGPLTPAQRSLHRNFQSSVRALRRDLVRAAHFLFQIQQRRIHRALGYPAIGDYARAVAGLTESQCRDLLRLGRVLPRFGEVETALRDGTLSWNQARLICDRTDPQDQRRWLDAARGMTVRQLTEVLARPAGGAAGQSDGPPTRHSPEQSAEQPAQHPAEHPAGQPSGQSPGNPAGPLSAPPIAPTAPTAAPVRFEPPIDGGAAHYVTLKFDGEQYARWLAWRGRVRSPGSLAEAVLDSLAGREGHTELQHLVVALECPACAGAVFPTNRGEIEVSGPLLEAVRCDATIEDEHGRRRRTVPPRLRRIAFRRARYRCQAQGCSRTSFLQVHHRLPVAGAGGDTPDNLVVLCWRCHRDLHEAEESARAALRAAPGC